MAQRSSWYEDFIRRLREQTQQPNFHGGLGTRLGSSAQRTIANYNLDLPTLQRRPINIEYIYCIKLPFVCTTPGREDGGLDLFRLPLCYKVAVQRRYRRCRPYSLTSLPPHLAMATLPQLFQSPTPQWTPYQVVKIGRSENPARRFHEILGAFQNLGIDVPLLQDISAADDPQTTIRKAKLHESVVFIVKVRDIGTAEEDIRKLLGKSLGQDFIDDFRKCLNEDQKKSFDDAGITEWVLVDNVLVTYFQEQFRGDQLWGHRHTPLNPYFLQRIPPSGSEIYQQLSSGAFGYNIRRRLPNCLREHLITLPKIGFRYTLNLQQ